MEHRRRLTNPAMQSACVGLTRFLAMAALLAPGSPASGETGPGVSTRVAGAHDYRGGHGVGAAGQHRTRWYFAEGAQGFFDTYLLILNENPVPALVTVSFLTEGAGTVSRVHRIPAKTRFTLAASTVPEVAGKSFSVVVDADVSVSAERAMYFGQGQAWDGGHVSPGIAEPTTSWFHAEGATGDFFDTYLLVANPNDVEATLAFTYLLADGTSVAKAHTVAPNARLTVNIEADDPLLADTAVSTVITSDVPVVSERAMYWPGDSSSWRGAHASTGVAGGQARWGVAGGRSGGTQGFETYLLVANLGDATAAVRVTFLLSDGPAAERTFSISPRSRFNVDVSAAAPELAGRDFGVLVTSTNGAPIVVERSTYWNTSDLPWAGGTSVTATLLP